MSDVENKNNIETEMLKKNILVRFMVKIMKIFGFTSGNGFIAVGGLWTIISLLSYVVAEPQNVYQQIVIENRFNQAQIGLLIVAMGVLITAIREKK